MEHTEQRSLSRDEVRWIDQAAVDQFGMSGIVLMENAGRGVADLLRSRGANGPVVICCGKGNNGGDGFVVARHLEAAGIDVEVLLFADPQEVRGNAASNLRILQHAGTPVTKANDLDAADIAVTLQAADWIVDALLGTGLSGEVRDPYASVIACINAAGRPVLAVDLPSGMDCNTGRPLGVCVRAAITATFVAGKIGFDAAGAADWTGEVVVLPIGVPRHLLDA